MKTESGIRVQLVHAWPEHYWSGQVDLPAGASVADALAASRADLVAAGVDLGGLALAVYGRAVEGNTRLRDGDRIELLRPLLLSPQQARAARAAAARRAGRK